MKVGDKVILRPDVMVRHARSIPAYMGYTTEQFAWRKALDSLEGQTGVINHRFDSGKVNVDFGGHVIGINENELVLQP